MYRDSVRSDLSPLFCWGRRGSIVRFDHLAAAYCIRFVGTDGFFFLFVIALLRQECNNSMPPTPVLARMGVKLLLPVIHLI